MSIEKRRSERFVLTGYVPGNFLDAQNQSLEYVLYDISERGLGIFFDPGPQSGEFITLTMDDRLIYSLITLGLMDEIP